MDGTFLWVSLTSFRHLALSIGLFQSQELVHLLSWYSFYPLYHSILLFFFRLIMKKTKKLNITKRAGTGCIFVISMAVQSQFCRPWTKHIYLYIFPSFGMVLVWPRFSLYHVSLVSSPPVGYLFQSYGEFVFRPARQTYTVSLFTAMVITESCFCSKGSLAWVGHSAVSLDLLFSRPSRSCQYHVLSHQMFWSSARAGLRRSPLTSCRRVCLLSTTTYCFESKPRAAPWPYFHHW